VLELDFLSSEVLLSLINSTEFDKSLSKTDFGDEEPWDSIEHYGADETRNVNVNNSDHNSSLSSIENQIIDDVQISIPQGMEDKNLF
jgi:hypothetical protein